MTIYITFVNIMHNHFVSLNKPKIYILEKLKSSTL